MNSKKKFAIKQQSVRTYLIWLVLACLLPGVLGTVVLFTYKYHSDRTQLSKDTTQTARALMQAVDYHVLRGLAIAQALSTDGSLAANDFAAFHQRAREAIALSGLGTNIVLRDRDGRQLLNTAVDFGKPLTLQLAHEQVREVFETGKPSVSDVFVGPVLRRPILSVDVPVKRNGQTIYALGIGILPDHFNTILKMQRLPEDWVLAIFDKTGTIVGRTHSADKYVGEKVVPQLFDSFTHASEGKLEASTKEGIPSVFVYTRSPVSNWGIAIAIPRANFTANLVSVFSVIAFGGAVLLALSMLFARRVGGRIASSVQALSAPAAALGGGGTAAVPDLPLTEAHEVGQAIERASSLLLARDATVKLKEKEVAEAHRLAKFGTWYWDIATGDVRSSETLEEIYGCKLPPFPEQRGTVLTIEAWEQVNAGFTEVSRTGKGYDLELEAIHGSGRHFWINAKCEPVFDAHGNLLGLRGMVQDITERKEFEENLRQFKVFVDHANDEHLLVDETGSIRYANQKSLMRLGYTENEILGMHVSDIDPMFPTYRLSEFFQKNKHDEIAPFEGVHRRKDGTTFPVEITATIFNVRGEWMMFKNSRDITERKQAEQRLKESALRDALTGLPNRALIFEYCDRLLAAAQRNHGRGALLFIDLDRFKPINDLHGHETGDKLLKEVSRRLTECVRHEDLVGRLGGDEFVIVLPYLEKGPHRAGVVAKHVIDSVCQPFHIDGLELSVSPSIGISFFPEHAEDVNALIHKADMAMYRAKQLGRANHQFYSPDLDEEAERLLVLEERLKRAVKKGDLQLHYQPIVDIHSGQLIGAEALVRLADSDTETVGPDRFIPVAESSGLITELGEWVVKEVCRQQESWRNEGIKIIVAMNVSPIQFKQHAFADRFTDIVLNSGVDPSCLEIEVTESAVMERMDEAIAILNRIKSHGIKVALDDFGTGYSSLSSLSSLPLDKIKVDQSFVRRIERDQSSRVVTDAIIALGRSLELKVVGEGIESEKTLRYLQDHGCNQAQGYWFSKPLSAKDFKVWYQDRAGNYPASLAEHP
ncbi:MAG TPA: hypothetical protein DHV59_15155 [Oxalobacteraceae bacterium]|nr:hypothetical protein [Oxalobacteraceae bacterium]